MSGLARRGSFSSVRRWSEARWVGEGKGERAGGVTGAAAFMPPTDRSGAARRQIRRVSVAHRGPHERAAGRLLPQLAKQNRLPDPDLGDSHGARTTRRGK
jgi:hypothetical protein